MNPEQLRLKTAMSKGIKAGLQDDRVRRRAEALRRNLQRRKLQARGRAAAAGEPAAAEARLPKDAGKQRR